MIQEKIQGGTCTEQEYSRKNELGRGVPFSGRDSDFFREGMVGVP